MTTATAYATALLELVTEKPGQEVHYTDRMIEVLKRNGHSKLLPAIVRAYEQVVAKQASHQKVVIKTATTDTTIVRKAEATAKQMFPGHLNFETVVDPTLVGGFVASTKSQQIDASYKTKLHQLYQQLTNA